MSPPASTYSLHGYIEGSWFAAVKTAKGRARVVDWLKTLENHTVKFAGSNDEMASYNFNWLWMELGVNELRR